MEAEAAKYLAAAHGLAPLVEASRDRFDLDRRLPVALVDAMGKAGLFGLWLPRALRGPELPPLSLLTITEELARQDGSVGWCTVIPAGYSRLAGAMEAAAAGTVFGSGRGVLAGSLNPTGKAVSVPGGYRVTGRWSYGSFIDYSDWVLGNCITEDQSGSLQAEDGGPAFRLCLFPREAVEVIDVWHVGGLRATGRMITGSLTCSCRRRCRSRCPASTRRRASRERSSRYRCQARSSVASPLSCSVLAGRRSRP
jgi:alkylation response protein AidB-like acyl-CoA dehydrogenase